MLFRLCIVTENNIKLNANFQKKNIKVFVWTLNTFHNERMKYIDYIYT